MLILTRNVGQTLYIGDDIAVEVLGARGEQVRIGIKAPMDVPIDRKELFNKKRDDRLRLREV
jgi:carbon storage regulator